MRAIATVLVLSCWSIQAAAEGRKDAKKSYADATVAATAARIEKAQKELEATKLSLKQAKAGRIDRRLSDTVPPKDRTGYYTFPSEDSKKGYARNFQKRIDELQAFLADPAKDVAATGADLAIDPRLGDVGRINSEVKVVEVINQTSAVVEVTTVYLGTIEVRTARRRYLLRGVSTKGWADDRPVDTGHPVVTITDTAKVGRVTYQVMEPVSIGADDIADIKKRIEAIAKK